MERTPSASAVTELSRVGQPHPLGLQPGGIVEVQLTGRRHHTWDMSGHTTKNRTDWQ